MSNATQHPARALRALVGATMLAAVSFGSAAAAGRKVAVSMPKEGIVVDGDLSDWDLASPVVLSKDTCRMRNGAVRGAGDLKALLYANFSRETFYVAVRVTDDERSGPLSGQAMWANDGVELWFDFSLDSDTSDMTRQEDDYQIALCYTSGAKDNPPRPGLWIYRNGRREQILLTERHASRKTSDGYILEMGIPHHALTGLAGRPGEVIGFDVSLVDRDTKKGTFTRLLWSSPREGNPRRFGFLTLGKVAPTALDAIVRKSEKIRSRKPQVSPKKAVKIDRRKYKGPPKILGVAAGAEKVGRYEKFELTFDALVEYQDPFDFEDVSIRARFVAPSGRAVTVDGFYYQGFRAYLSGEGSDNLTPRGEPTWKVRFAPTEPGRYTYAVTLRDKAGRTARARPGAFTAVESDSPGFLRVSRTDPHYMEFDSGKPFYGTGYACHMWKPTSVDVLLHKHYLSQLAAFGGNYMSVNFETGTDSPFSLTNARTGLKTFSMRNAFKVDYLLAAAQKRGVYILPCMVQTATAKTSFWSNSRYNVKRGGPCKAPEEFFTHPEARGHIRRRLRYTVARWGYSQNILGWELFNEVNYTAGFQMNIDSVRAWHKETAAYLKTIDPNRHLVSTSFGSGDNVEDDVIWRMPEIDFTITHEYGGGAAGVRSRLWRKWNFGKPHLGGEFGNGYPAVNKAADYDREGIFLHNGIWTCAMAGSAGNILFWWNTRYWDTADVAYHFRPFTKFIEGVRWTTAGFKPIELRPMKGAGKPGYADFIIGTPVSWGRPGPRKYAVARGEMWAVLREIDKSITDPRLVEAVHTFRTSSVAGTRFGAVHRAFRKDLVLVITAGQDTQIEIGLKAVAKAGTALEVRLNGKVVQSPALADTDGRDDPDADELKRTLTVKLPAGTNTLVLRNTGPGWVQLGGMVLRRFSRSDAFGQAVVFGLHGRSLSLLWFHNRRNTSMRHLEGRHTLTPVADVTAVLPDMADGPWAIEWWDTYRGKIFKRETLTASGRKLTLRPPPFRKDIACKIRRMPAGGRPKGR